MRLRPPVVYRFQSRAESRVFEMLRESDFDETAVALHSLNLPRHAYKQWAEVDFVVISTRGVFLLEIKGGGIECREGIWYFRNRFGEEHRRSEGPFDQVRTAMFALQSMLRDGGHRELSQRFVWGWGVVFPDASFPAAGVEIPPETILDREGIGRDGQSMDPFLARLDQYWSGKTPSIASPRQKDVDALVAVLRPDFEVVPSLGQRLETLSEQIVRLTGEQLRVLDCSDENPRILCQGAAGTGKTILATELARRAASEGVRTAFVSRRPELGGFLARSLPANVEILDWSENESSRSDKDRFGRLIVDEGQDLLSEEGWSFLDRLVNGGLVHGEWRIFMDPNNQAGLEAAVDDAVLARLRDRAAVVKLTRNCRNTTEIVVQTSLLTGAVLGEAQVDGVGLPVQLVTASGDAEVARSLDAQLRRWLAQDVRPGAITILSPKEWNESAVRHLSRDLADAIDIVDQTLLSRWPPTSMTFSSIRGFKGLENRCIAVIDLDDFDGLAQWISLLYVGMTRANAVLWIAVPASRKKLFDELQARHALRMVHR